MPLVGKVSKELEKRGQTDEEQRPGPGWHLSRERADVDPTDNRYEKVIAANRGAGADHHDGGKLLLNALKLLTQRGDEALFLLVELTEFRPRLQNGSDPKP